MNLKPEHVGFALCCMLSAGLVLIAQGTGMLTGKWSVGACILGAAISWAAMKLLEQTGR
jgi:hypothetical protein